MWAATEARGIGFLPFPFAAHASNSAEQGIRLVGQWEIPGGTLELLANDSQVRFDIGRPEVWPDLDRGEVNALLKRHPACDSYCGAMRLREADSAKS